MLLRPALAVGDGDLVLWPYFWQSMKKKKNSALPDLSEFYGFGERSL